MCLRQAKYEYTTGIPDARTKPSMEMSLLMGFCNQAAIDIIRPPSRKLHRPSRWVWFQIMELASVQGVLIPHHSCALA